VEKVVIIGRVTDIVLTVLRVVVGEAVEATVVVALHIGGITSH
jgi:hypothetical protein